MESKENDIMKRTKLGRGFKLLVLIVCMTSFGAWFLQPYAGPLYTIIFSALAVVISVADKKCFNFSNQNTNWFLLLFVATLLTCTGMNFTGYMVALVGLIPTFFIFKLESEYKEDLFHFLRKSLGIMILISLPFYFLFLAGVNLPHFEIVRESSDASIDFHYTVYYLFTIKNDGDLLSILLPRYEFVFYEPGYFGCLMAVLLYLGRFKFDKLHWENIIFLISLILSMSVAGILIALFGFVVYSIRKSEHRARWIVSSVIFLGGFYLAVVNYNGGDNLINNALFSRFEYDDATGKIAGNSRFSEDVSDYFWTKFIHSDELMFGMKNPDRVLTNNNVDYLSFIIRHGLVALCMLMLFLYYPAIKNKKARYNLLCFAALYTLIFAQGSFSVFWAMNMYIFVLGVNYLSLAEEKIVFKESLKIR